VIRALASLGASLFRPGWESFDKHLIFSPGLAARRFRAAFSFSAHLGRTTGYHPWMRTADAAKVRDPR
jgi:hypothetical protein